MHWYITINHCLSIWCKSISFFSCLFHIVTPLCQWDNLTLIYLWDTSIWYQFYYYRQFVSHLYPSKYTVVTDTKYYINKWVVTTLNTTSFLAYSPCYYVWLTLGFDLLERAPEELDCPRGVLMPVMTIPPEKSFIPPPPWLWVWISSLLCPYPVLNTCGLCFTDFIATAK